MTSGRADSHSSGRYGAWSNSKSSGLSLCAVRDGLYLDLMSYNSILFLNHTDGRLSSVGSGAGCGQRSRLGALALRRSDDASIKLSLLIMSFAPLHAALGHRRREESTFDAVKSVLTSQDVSKFPFSGFVLPVEIRRRSGSGCDVSIASSVV